MRVAIGGLGPAGSAHGRIRRQVAALVCVGLVGSKLQPLVAALTGQDAMSDFNCHVELLLEQPGVNGMSSGIGINVVVGPNWFQVPAT